MPTLTKIPRIDTGLSFRELNRRAAFHHIPLPSRAKNTIVGREFAIPVAMQEATT
jgi:hypothetical protein